MNKKNYRKVCHECRNQFKGRKDAKYCSDLCRVRNNRRYRSSSLYKQISAILAIEFDGMNLNEAEKIIKICISAVKRAKRANVKYGNNLSELVVATKNDSKTPMSVDEKREMINKLLKK